MSNPTYLARIPNAVANSDALLGAPTSELLISNTACSPVIVPRILVRMNKNNPNNAKYGIEIFTISINFLSVRNHNANGYTPSQVTLDSLLNKDSMNARQDNASQ